MIHAPAGAILPTVPPSRTGDSRAKVAALLLALGALSTTASAAPPVPGNCRAIPDYADGSIVVEWDDVDGEDGYRVFRAESATGPFDPVGPVLPADTTILVDPGLDPGAEYFYRVRSFDGSGESGDSNLFQQNVKVVWPNPGHNSLLHNWNETIGFAAANGFHRGCDIQQVGETNDLIVFPRGGVVARAGINGQDNLHIYVEVKIGAELRYDSFNHLKGKKFEDLGIDVGDYVRAGAPIVPIGSKYFTPGSIDFVDHVHFFTPSDPFTNETDGQHPLKIFSVDVERDPGNARPLILDHGLLSDGTVIFHRQGSPPGPPYLALPLGDDPATPETDEGDVDVHVEIADVMGNGTTEVPTSIAYWIEGRECDGSPPVVRDGAQPYTLLRWDNRMFRDEIVTWQDLVDEAQDLGPYISYEGTNYPGWNNFKHFIVTNTSGTDGAPSNVDPAQFWNTDARDDGTPAVSPGANFAGAEDAARAEDARFPDGNYVIHVIMDDLIGTRSDAIQDVQLENFPPAVVSGGLLDHDTGQYRIEFSEPMDSSTIETGLGFRRVGGRSVDHGKAWSAGGCAVVLTPVESPEACAWYEITLDADVAADLEARLLDGAFGTPSHDGVAGGSAVDSVQFLFAPHIAEEVPELTVDSSDPGVAWLTWPVAGQSESYAITRGTLVELAPGQYGDCLISGLVLPEHEDTDVPPPGTGYFYLVQGENATCGVGTLGTDFWGAERLNQDPDACGAPGK